MTMTKKDFEAIAGEVSIITDDKLRMLAAETFARILARTNPRFDKVVFFLACDTPELVEELRDYKCK